MWGEKSWAVRNFHGFPISVFIVKMSKRLIPPFHQKTPVLKIFHFVCLGKDKVERGKAEFLRQNLDEIFKKKNCVEMQIFIS